MSNENKKSKIKRENPFSDALNIFKENSTPIDMSEVYKSMNESQKKDRERFRNEVAEENLRIENISCPCCGCLEKSLFVQGSNNGIMGPGFKSNITNQYYICQVCGIHFSDLKMKEITPPIDRIKF